jgi:hypothetical protein
MCKRSSRGFTRERKEVFIMGWGYPSLNRSAMYPGLRSPMISKIACTSSQSNYPNKGPAGQVFQCNTMQQF